jgi:ribonuclease HI
LANKKKYYAVKKGHTTGILSSWEECKLSINGYSGAEYKSFATEEEAQAYLDGRDLSEKHIEQAISSNTVIAYVDGSFSEELKKYSFGCVIITPDEEIIKEYNCGNKEEALPSKNIAGELAGAMYAITWAVSHGYKKIIIRHDYEGLSKWYNKEWNAKSYVSIEYIEFLKKYQDLIDIQFEKVSAHTNDTFNEEADKLAKKGLGLKNKKRLNSGASWFTVEGVTIEEIDTIFQILVDDFEDLNVTKSEEPNITVFYANKGKDRLTVQRFSSTGRTVIQGKPKTIFHSFVTYLTQLLDVNEITPILNSCFKVSIEKEKINEQYSVYLPNLPDTIKGKLKNSLLQSIYNLNYSGDMFDYTYLLHPALRALEGHIKLVLNNHLIPIEKDKISSCFHKLSSQYEIIPDFYKLLPNSNYTNYINDTYNFYCNHRHTLFHWDEPLADIDTTRVIQSKNEADILIKETLDLINKYYLLS